VDHQQTSSGAAPRLLDLEADALLRLQDDGGPLVDELVEWPPAISAAGLASVENPTLLRQFREAKSCNQNT
jgi:hypothetical protein